MILSHAALKTLASQDKLAIPDERLLELPEKVLQFGTGVLLRGLPDYFIDKANKEGNFNGRVVIVKSTSGETDAFDKQDGLFTLCVRGVEGNTTVEEDIINASISKVLSAKNDWEKILHYAGNPDIELIISNTTEVGITLGNDDVHDIPPQSFPGKLLAFLYRRFKIYEGAGDKGLVIIPTELILNNGAKLKSIVLELAKRNHLEEAFSDWINNSNYFCNSLVDRIVPGKLNAEQQAATEEKLGYKDDLMIMSEVYRLWAIETSERRVHEVLSFSKSDPGVVITEDIELFRELKLRLLNGSHSFSCGLAHLCGFTTVKEAMADLAFRDFVTGLMLEEIVPSIVSPQIPPDKAIEFARTVVDRFRNPHLEHQWSNIGVQYSLKMKSRNVPIIANYFRRFDTVPQRMAIGFAGFLLFMRSPVGATGTALSVHDENALLFHERWKGSTPIQVVTEILADEKLWEVNLSAFPGFIESILTHIETIERDGAKAAVINVLVSDGRRSPMPVKAQATQ